MKKVILICLILASRVFSEEKVIANWDIIPGQKINSNFKAGVIAFHKSGVNVLFRINKSKEIKVDKPEYNERTNVFEYYISLSEDDFIDNKVELEAIAFADDKNYKEKTLNKITLLKKHAVSNILWVDCISGDNTKGTGTQNNPLKSIYSALEKAKAGDTIYLKKGRNYSLENKTSNLNFSSWVSISGEPGSQKDQITILGGYSQGNNIKFSNLTMYKEKSGTNTSILYVKNKQNIWFDNVILEDIKGPYNNGDVINNQGGTVYITNSTIRNITNACAGFNFLRNIEIVNIGSDVFRGKDDLFAVNINVKNIMPKPGMHADLIQFYNPEQEISNLIFYNIKAININAQAIFGTDENGKVENIAFVNMLIKKGNEKYHISQLRNLENVLLWHSTFVNSEVYLRHPGTLKEFNIQNNIFYKIYPNNQVPFDETLMKYNHTQELNWNQKKAMGACSSYGIIILTSDNNYKLNKKSLAYKSGIPLECVPADINNKLYEKDCPNLGALSCK